MPEFSGAEIRKIIDKTPELLARVEGLGTADVLVGVPKARGPRRQGSISNAELAYIHEFGSPARNIPARPFLFPGVRKIRREAVTLMRQGALDALRGAGNLKSLLARVGVLARNSVVNEITDPDPPFTPLQASTIRARLRRTSAGRRQLKGIVARGKGVGQSSSEALLNWAGEGNAKPLIDTGQLRASITYVVVDR